MNDWLIIILVYLTLFIGSPLITLLHELGHAFAYMWLTKPESIDIYVGSYGGRQKYLTIKQGRLNIYIRRSWMILRGSGMCVSSEIEADYRKHIVILLAGVFFTLFITCIPAAIVFYTQASLLAQIVCYLFLVLSALSLLTNLIPMNLSNGINSYGKDRGNLESDGRQILFAVKAKKVYADYRSALQFMMEKNYEGAIEKLKAVNHAVPKTEKILRNLYSACIHTKRYDEAINYLVQLEAVEELPINDLINKGYLYSLTGKHDEAIVLYQKALKKNRNNYIVLNNLGYEMIKKGAHKVGAQLLEKALKIKPGFITSQCNIAFSKILQDQPARGKQLLDEVLAVHPNAAPAYLYLAIYYLKMNDRNLAETNLARALEIDDSIITTDYDEELEKLSESIQL